MDPRVDEVIEMWFGNQPTPSPAIFARWFTKDPAFDAEIRARFGALVEEAASGALDGWRGESRSALALIVVLDQLSRNIYRDDPRAFAQDSRALAVARALRDSGRARELGLYQRMIALMPLQHAEDRAIQAESVAAFEALVEDARATGNPNVIGPLGAALDFAKKHRDIVERFGRYPHRNAILGRESTAEELAFLEQPDSRF